MAENVYEGMFILDSNRYGRDPEAVSGQISKIIEKAGGEILVNRIWEERRLAYTIKGHRKGTYWLTYFRLEGSRLSGLERQCRLGENILRSLFLKVDPRIADALVAHAQAGHIGSSGTGSRESDARGTERSGTRDAERSGTGKASEEAKPAVAVADKEEPNRPDAPDRPDTTAE